MRKEPEDLPQAVILTAIPVEYQSVRQHLHEVHEVIHEQGTVYEQGTFLAKGKTCKVGIAQVRMGNAQSAAEAERAMTYFAPRFAFFVGVAGGIQDVKLGDVVAATKVYAYESGKEEIHFQTRPEVGLPAYALLQRAQIEANRSAWLQRCGEIIPQLQPKVVVAPIAAGEKIQASTRSATYKLIRAAYGDAVAVEMEGYGFLLALHAHPQVGGLVIRGISDLIDGNNEADTAYSQERAACHASAFAFEVLAGLIGQIDGEFSRFAPPKNSRETPPPVSLAGGDIHFHLQQYGPNTGIVQQGNYNHNVQNFITHASAKDELKEGRTCLLRGQSALLRKDYIDAKQLLTEAARLLHEDHAPTEKAQVCYLQALTLLEWKRPFGLALPTMRRIEQQMEEAVALHPTYVYLLAAALFKRDFARNRWKESQYRYDAQTLMQRAQETQRIPEDEKNLAILTHCQPHLVQDAQQW